MPLSPAQAKRLTVLVSELLDFTYFRNHYPPESHPGRSRQEMSSFVFFHRSETLATQCMQGQREKALNRDRR